MNLSTGYAGTVRHVPLLFRHQESVVPSFVLLTAALAVGQSPIFNDAGVVFGDRTVALDIGRHLVLRPYGPRGTIPSVSGRRMLDASPPDLAGRVVLIGASAVGVSDMLATPFSAVVPGVEVLATAVDNLLAGDALVRTQRTRWIDAGVAGGLALAAVALIAMRRVLVGLTLVFLLGVAWALVTLVAFDKGYWLSTMLPIAAMAPVAAFYGCSRLVLERGTALRLATTAQGLWPFQADVPVAPAGQRSAIPG